MPWRPWSWCVDIDVSVLLVSKRVKGAEKGYVAKQRNQHTRQLGRVLISQIQVIICHAFYAGNTRSDSVFKSMVEKLQMTLKLDT